MSRRLTLLFCCLFLLYGRGRAGDYTDQEGRAAWARWKARPITESNFRAVCDLLQDIGKTNINLSYEILEEYVPMVRKTGNRDQVHILLMGWAKAKESLVYFEDAEKLYAQARENAMGNARHYDEALVGTLLMFADWGRMDSVEKYAEAGRVAAEKAGDRESLSFIYTFRAMALLTDTAALGRSLEKAISLGEGLRDKNALFTAKYNYASIYCRNNPQREVLVLEELLSLTKDSTLNHKPKLYERSAFTFRNPLSNIYLQLMQVNIMLADYDNAGKFGELLYEAVVKPNPGAAQTAYFETELAMVKAYQGEFGAAREYLSKAGALFKVPEEKIPYPSWFLAAGMVAEHEGNMSKALPYYEHAYRMGPMEGLHLMPSELYYAHGLIATGRLEEAGKVLGDLGTALPARTYSSYGFYYYKYLSALEKARGDYFGYAKALETYHTIRDSLISFRQYRAIREIEERMRVRDKEQQIERLHAETAERERNMRRERIYFGISLVLAILAAVFMVITARNRIRIRAEAEERKKVADQLHDEVGGMLSLAILNVSSSVEKREGASIPRLEKAQDILESVSTTIRELSHRLTPLNIEKLGFRKAVEDLVYSANLSGRLKVSLILTGFEKVRGYRKEMLDDLYRMVQELLNNVVKHARASQVLLELTEHDNVVSLMVEDDGVGVGEDVSGRGLDMMRAKVAFYHGRMEVNRRREGGTLVVIEFKK